MGRHSSDSDNQGKQTESPNLSTRRKRRKTKGERNKLFSKSRHQDRSIPSKKQHLRESGHSGGGVKQRRILTSLAIPMIKDNVSTITSSRLTRRIGLFDKKKSSETVMRNLVIPEHTVKKTSEDLRKILDLEDSGLQKPVDIDKLKRLKLANFSTEGEAAEMEVETSTNQRKIKSSRKNTEPVYTVSSSGSSVGVEYEAVVETDGPTGRTKKHQFPKEPDFATISESVRTTLRLKNHFGERDLVHEIRSRLRTMLKASSPSPSTEVTPQQRIPTKPGSISSDIVKRDSSQDNIEISKSDSEMHVSVHKTNKKAKVCGSSNSKGIINLSHSGRESKRPQSQGQLPVTHTIPRITVDALSDAKYLLHLNDNPGVLSQLRNGPFTSAECGYMESRVKAYGIRRALAPITNVTLDRNEMASHRNHPWVQQGLKPVVQSHMDHMGHFQGNAPLACSSHHDPLGVHPFTKNVRMTESRGNLRQSASFVHEKRNASVITSNQNAVAQYVYPAAYEQNRYRVSDDFLKYYEDPLYSYPSMPLSSQETFKSTDTYRSGRNEETRYRKVSELFPGPGGDQRQVDMMDLLEAADVPPSDQPMKSPNTSRRYFKPKSRTPSPPIIYPCRLYSKCD